MPFMKNEALKDNQFVKYLHNRKIKDLNPDFRKLIEVLYGEVNKDRVVKAFLVPVKKKYDLVISINNIMKRISLKMDNDNIVHEESMNDFLKFLIVNNVKREVLKDFLKSEQAICHMNDNGLDGLSLFKSREYQDKIRLLNRELNKTNILRKAILRFIIQGSNSNYKIDALIYGSVDSFTFATGLEIEKMIMSKMYIGFAGIHFANLSCEFVKKIKTDNFQEDKCLGVRIKWNFMKDDIMEIRKNYQIIECEI